MPKIREADKGELSVAQYTGLEALPISSGSREAKYVTTATIGLAAEKPWSKITDTPTTLDGYGITEVEWAKVTGAPTTLAGYGITDLQNVHFVSQYASLSASLTAIGSTSPSSYGFQVGDIVENSSPVVGQPKGWICTVAGTPGTWVSIGNL